MHKLYAEEKMKQGAGPTDLMSGILTHIWGGQGGMFEESPTTQLLKTQSGFALFNRSVAPLDSVTLRRLGEFFRINRPKYSDDLNADSMAWQDSVEAYARTGAGPDVFAPIHDGQDPDDGMRFSSFSISKWAGNEGNAIILMDNVLRKFMAQPAAYAGELPKKWKDYAIQPSLKRMQIFSSGIRDGHVTMTPAPGSTKAKPVWDVLIRDPKQTGDLSRREGIIFRYAAHPLDVQNAVGEFRVQERRKEKAMALGETVEALGTSKSRPRIDRRIPLSQMSLGAHRLVDPERFYEGNE